MRKFDTYRGYLRNFFRRNVFVSKRRWVQEWAHNKFWEKANEVAKLPLRARQCADAREAEQTAFAHAYVARASLRFALTQAKEALLGYWRTQKRTRVVNRIINGLVPA